MKNLINNFINKFLPKRLIDKLYILSLLSICVTMFFKNNINSIAIIISVIIFFMDYKNLRTYFIFITRNKIALSCIAIYVLMAISLFYSNNFKYGMERLSKSLIFIIFPIILSKVVNMKKEIKLIQSVYIIICVIVVVICLYGAYYDSFVFNGGYSKVVPPSLYLDFFYYRFSYHKLSSHINMHPIYLSADISFCVFLLFKKTNKTIFHFFLIVVFTLFIFLLESVMINLVFITYAILLIYRGKEKYKYLLYGFILLLGGFNYLFIIINKSTGTVYHFDNTRFNIWFLIIFICVLFLVYLLYKFKSIKISLRLLIPTLAFLIIGYFIFIFSINLLPKENNRLNNFEARLYNWTSSKSIIEQYPWFGVGIGDVQKALVNEYKKRNLLYLSSKKFNEHSQYLYYWSSLGIFGISLFIWFLYISFKQAIKDLNYEFIGLLLLCFFFSFSETIFLRQYGLVFFLFFINLHSYELSNKYLSEKQKRQKGFNNWREYCRSI